MLELLNFEKSEIPTFPNKLWRLCGEQNSAMFSCQLSCLLAPPLLAESFSISHPSFVPSCFLCPLSCPWFDYMHSWIYWWPREQNPSFVSYSCDLVPHFLRDASKSYFNFAHLHLVFELDPFYVNDLIHQIVMQKLHVLVEFGVRNRQVGVKKMKWTLSTACLWAQSWV